MVGKISSLSCCPLVVCSSLVEWGSWEGGRKGWMDVGLAWPWMCRVAGAGETSIVDVVAEMVDWIGR